jgi:fucose permease
LAICCYGLGIGIAIPACNLQVANANPDRRASALNVLNFVWTAGALAWAPFAAALSTRRFSFLVLGAFVALFTICLALARLQSAGPAHEDTRSQSKSGPPVSVFLLTALLFFLYIGVESAWAGWATSYAQRMNATTRLWIFAPAFFWGALLLGRALAPFLLKRIPEDVLLIVDLAMVTAAGCFVLASSNMVLLFATLSVLGFALASVYPNLIARMSRDLEGNTAATGYMFAAAGTGGAVLPWVVGAVSSRFGGIRAGLAVAIAASALMLAIQISRSRRTSALIHSAQSTVTTVS